MDEITEFIRIFTTNSQAIKKSGNNMHWRFGALQFSNIVKPIINFTDEASTFITAADQLNYMDGDAYVDCALKATTEAILKDSGASRGVTFVFVLSDGHSTGNSCGGISEASEAMKTAGIKIFVVATNQNTVESELLTISSYPAEILRNSYLVSINKDRNKTISRMIDIMVRIVYLVLFLHTYVMLNTAVAEPDSNKSLDINGFISVIQRLQSYHSNGA